SACPRGACTSSRSGRPAWAAVVISMVTRPIAIAYVRFMLVLLFRARTEQPACQTRNRAKWLTWPRARDDGAGFSTERWVHDETRERSAVAMLTRCFRLKRRSAM